MGTVLHRCTLISPCSSVRWTDPSMITIESREAWIGEDEKPYEWRLALVHSFALTALLSRARGQPRKATGGGFTFQIIAPAALQVTLKLDRVSVQYPSRVSKTARGIYDTETFIIKLIPTRAYQASMYATLELCFFSFSFSLFFFSFYLPLLIKSPRMNGIVKNGTYRISITRLILVWKY